jgi:hypothetical protein
VICQPLFVPLGLALNYWQVGHVARPIGHHGFEAESAVEVARLCFEMVARVGCVASRFGSRCVMRCGSVCNAQCCAQGV